MSNKSESLEFLPAALEIQQTPPLPMARNILWAIMALFTIAVAWACIGHVDIVGVAQGKIVPSGRVKTVQPLETGIVKAIHVDEGERVAQGDLLIELEDAKPRADLKRLTQEREAAQWEATRLRAQLAAIDEFADPQDYFSRGMARATFAPVSAPHLNPRIVQALNEHYASLAALDEEVRENRAERSTFEHRIARLDATIPLIAERTESLKQLEAQSLAPRANWLELQEERVDQEKEREVVRTQLTVTDAALSNLQQRRNVLNAQTQSKWMNELADLDTRLRSFDQEILKAETRVNETRLPLARWAGS